MYTKEQIWTAFTKEFRILKHLAEKIPAGGEHHKPTEKQRTTLELMHYIAGFGGGIFSVIKTGEGAAFMDYANKVQDITVDSFAKAIDEQEVFMKNIFDELTPELLAEEISAWGMTQSRAVFLLDALKMLNGLQNAIIPVCKSRRKSRNRNQ
jgi:hypothetical protein